MASEGRLAERDPGDLGSALTGVRLAGGDLQFGSAATLQLFESVPVAISVTVGPEHRFLYANARYRDALVAGSADIVGRRLRDVLGDSLPSRTYALRDRVIAEKKVLHVPEEPIPPRSENPSAFWDVTFFPLVDEVHGAAGVLTFAIDVSARVRARMDAEERAEIERARAEEASFHRARLALAVDATSLGIWEWNVETGETIWSEAQKAIWGLPADQPVTYEQWRDSIHPDDRETVLGRLTHTLDPSSGGDQRLEHRIVRPSGAVRWISSHGRMIYDERTGRPLRLIGTALDITRNKRNEEELHQALASREILIREVNHRVKNSLQLVSSMLSLQGGRLADPSMREAILEAQSRVQAVAAVHDRLYRSEDLESVDLDIFLETLCRDLERTIGDDASVRLEITAEPVTLDNDLAVPIALVLNELLTNAIKYAYPNREGTIRISLRRKERGKASLTVADDGVGLPEVFAERRGTSLGFRIIEGLARQINAEIDIIDRRPGTAVSLTFSVGEA